MAHHALQKEFLCLIYFFVSLPHASFGNLGLLLRTCYAVVNLRITSKEAADQLNSLHIITCENPFVKQFSKFFCTFFWKFMKIFPVHNIYVCETRSDTRYGEIIKTNSSRDFVSIAFLLYIWFRQGPHAFGVGH